MMRERHATWSRRDQVADVSLGADEDLLLEALTSCPESRRERLATWSRRDQVADVSLAERA
jgi:hypothetical protein